MDVPLRRHIGFQKWKYIPSNVSHFIMLLEMVSLIPELVKENALMANLNSSNLT